MATATAQKVDLAQGGRQQFPWPKCCLKADQNLAAVGAPGAAAVVTVAADTARGFILKQAFPSYNLAPAAGSSLVITDGTTTLTFYVETAGTFPIAFDPPIQFAQNAQVTATLSAPGGAILASLILNGWMEL